MNHASYISNWIYATLIIISRIENVISLYVLKECYILSLIASSFSSIAMSGWQQEFETSVAFPFIFNKYSLATTELPFINSFIKKKKSVLGYGWEENKNKRQCVDSEDLFLVFLHTLENYGMFYS